MKREPFRHVTGAIASLPVDNVDTDQIIPSREMKTVSRKGLGEGLFAGWRYLDAASRHANPDFVLNKPEGKKATILVTGLNFGCGSSREHAVWALAEYGFRAIIAKSFGAIFHDNCLRNGILPVTLATYEIELLHAFGAGRSIEIDLETQSVTTPSIPGWRGRFEIDAFAKRLLMEGLDPIGLTLQDSPQIDDFIARDRRARPWLYSAAVEAAGV